MEDEDSVMEVLRMVEPEEETKCEQQQQQSKSKNSNNGRSNKSIIEEVAERLRSGGDTEEEEEAKIEAARDIRKLVRKSSSSAKTRSRFAAAGVIPPLVQMLCPSSSSLPAREAALLALLNLAVRNDRSVISPLLLSDIIPFRFSGAGFDIAHALDWIWDLVD